MDTSIEWGSHQGEPNCKVYWKTENDSLLAARGWLAGWMVGIRRASISICRWARARGKNAWRRRRRRPRNGRNGKLLLQNRAIQRKDRFIDGSLGQYVLPLRVFSFRGMAFIVVSLCTVYGHYLRHRDLVEILTTMLTTMMTTAATSTVARQVCNYSRHIVLAANDSSSVRFDLLCPRCVAEETCLWFVLVFMPFPFHLLLHRIPIFAWDAIYK